MPVDDLVLNNGDLITGSVEGVAPNYEDARQGYWMVKADWKCSDDNCLVCKVASRENHRGRYRSWEYLWRILLFCVGIPVQNVSLLLETSDELKVVSMTYLKL